MPRRAAIAPITRPAAMPPIAWNPRISPTAPPSRAEDLQHEDHVQDDEEPLGHLARGADPDDRPRARGRGRSSASRRPSPRRTGGRHGPWPAPRRPVVAGSPWSASSTLRSSRARDGRHERGRGEERDRVDRHDPREPEARDDEPAERRADADGRGCLRGPRDRSPARAPSGGTSTGTSEACAGPPIRARPDWAAATRYTIQSRSGWSTSEERQQEQRLEEARHDEDPAPVEAVDQHAADLPDHEARDELDDEDRRGRERGAGELEHDDREPDQQRPVAEVADEVARPEQREAAPPERGGDGRGGDRAPASRQRPPEGAERRRGRARASGGASSRVRAMNGRIRASSRSPSAASSDGGQAQVVGRADRRRRARPRPGRHRGRWPRARAALPRRCRHGRGAGSRRAATASCRASSAGRNSQPVAADRQGALAGRRRVRRRPAPRARTGRARGGGSCSSTGVAPTTAAHWLAVCGPTAMR